MEDEGGGGEGFQLGVRQRGDVDGEDASAAFGEEAACFEADTASGAGNDGDAAGEVHAHLGCLIRLDWLIEMFQWN